MLSALAFAKLAELRVHWKREVGHGALGAYLLSEQSSMAQPYLLQALETTTRIANLELEGLAHAILAEVHYQMGMFSGAVSYACLGMYLLNQKQSIER